MPNRYSGFPASFNTGGLVLNQIGAARQTAGQKISDIVPSGSVDRAASAMSAAESACQITTGDLATALGTVSPTIGYACTGPSKFQYQKRADPSSYSSSGIFATSGHQIATAQTGFLYPGQLEASGDNEAKLTLMFIPFWDGIHDPLAFASAGLGGSPGYNSHYYMGPLYLSGAQIPGVLSVSIAFGITCKSPRFDGDPYPRTSSIISRRPMFKINVEHVDVIEATLGTMYHAALGATMAQYFRLGSPGGVRAADTSAVHVKISAAAGSWGAEDLGFQEEADGSVSLFVRPTGTISMSLGSTIP
jgi:hypothetical protein